MSSDSDKVSTTQDNASTRRENAPDSEKTASGSDQASDEKDTAAGIDQYLARVQKMSDEQQEKVIELINKTQQDLNAWNPQSISPAHALDEQMETLYQNVNNELEKAMDQLSQQIKEITQ